MIINTFNAAWFIMFAVQIALILFLYFLCKGKTEKFKVRVMTVFYIFLVVFYIVYKWYLISPVSPYETSLWLELPLALCQVASFLALPAIRSRNRVLMGFCFLVGSICSLLAMLMPSPGFSDIPLLCGESIGFYGFHGLVFVQSIAIYVIGLYNPCVKDAPKVALLLGVFALIAHGINFVLRSTVCDKANYFFTYDPDGNPILGLIRQYIDINYVYLLPFLVPAGLVFALLALILHKKEKT